MPLDALYACSLELSDALDELICASDASDDDATSIAVLYMAWQVYAKSAPVGNQEAKDVLLKVTVDDWHTSAPSPYRAHPFTEQLLVLAAAPSRTAITAFAGVLLCLVMTPGSLPLFAGRSASDLSKLLSGDGARRVQTPQGVVELHDLLLECLPDWRRSIAQARTILSVFDLQAGGVPGELQSRLLAASATPLSLSDQETIKELVKADVGLVMADVLGPSDFTQLVEHNEALAQHLFLKTSVDTTAWAVQCLLQADRLSLPLVNVAFAYIVNAHDHDTTAGFIAHATTLVWTAASDDRQLRWVRMVCKFVRALCRQGVIALSDSDKHGTPLAADQHSELQAFALEFSREREAAALYRDLSA
ncbi:CCR4-NOT transcription complex subunit 11 [Sorochytrium milnesiophthora]